MFPYFCIQATTGDTPELGSIFRCFSFSFISFSPRKTYTMPGLWPRARTSVVNYVIWSTTVTVTFPGTYSAQDSVFSFLRSNLPGIHYAKSRGKYPSLCLIGSGWRAGGSLERVCSPSSFPLRPASGVRTFSPVLLSPEGLGSRFKTFTPTIKKGTPRTHHTHRYTRVPRLTKAYAVFQPAQNDPFSLNETLAVCSRLCK